MNSRAFRLFSVMLFILPALCVINAACALAQGTVIFDNRVVGVVVSHVYMPSAANPGVLQIGNGTADFPAGTTDWTSWTPVSGSGFSAQLFAAPGANVPVDSLAPAFPITTFRTGIAAGFVSGVTATLTGVPINATVATVQMRVWDNQGGTIADWATALAQPSGTELVGMSAPINVSNIGGLPGTPPSLVGLQSFNLTYIPEPSTFALTGVGGLLLWFVWSRSHRSRHRER